jgi:hypothetical protein
MGHMYVKETIHHNIHNHILHHDLSNSQSEQKPKKGQAE